MAGCVCCGTDMTPTLPGGTRHEARGLCEPCYARENYHDRLDDYPRRTWSRDELMSEWDFLRQDGYTRRNAAERLGVKWATFDRAFYRARAAGDPRAVPELSPQWTRARERGDTHAMAR